MMGGGDIEEGRGMIHSTSSNSLRRRMAPSTSALNFQTFLEVLAEPRDEPRAIASNAASSDEARRPRVIVSPPPSSPSGSSSKRNDRPPASVTSDNITTSEGESSFERKKLEDEKHDGAEGDEGHTDGDHGHAGPTAASLVASSVVCFIIYFVFCIVFSSVVWDPLQTYSDRNIDPPFGIPQGVGINLVGIAAGSLFFAWKSGCRAVVGGPDLLPVVFFAEAGVCVLTYVTNQYSNMVANCEDGGDGMSRLLGGDGATPYGDDDPCAGHLRHLAEGGGTGLPAEFVARIVPTTLVAMMFGNLLTAAVFCTLGKMRNTASVIGFIPASVVAGFLTCIGYKVIKLAVLITTGYHFKQKYVHNIGNDLDHANDPWLPLTIALFYGISLYALKRLHVVAAEKLILGYILVPIVVFFVVCAAHGTGMDTLREQDWFLTQSRDGDGCTHDCAFTTTDFWQTLQVAYGSGSLVEWGAIPTCVPIFVMGATMTSLDAMLKLTSTEKALGVDLDYNREMMLGGEATLLSSLLCGSPAYGQTKFNVINFSIARTVDSPLPTVYLGIICLVVFLSGVAGPIINIMPRFLLGGLCVFAGVGFLYENLWEGRRNMNRASFAIVWIIFLVNFVWEFFILQNLPKTIQPMVPGLLVVFILGIVLSTFEFMFAFMHKAKPPVIRNGDECCSSAVRSEKHDTQLAVMAPWFQVFSVESFVFFGTANNLYQQLKAHLADQKSSRPRAERTKCLVFDLTEVTGIDSSAKDVFFKVHRLLKKEGINLVWAMSNPKIVDNFRGWGLLEGVAHHATLDLALRRVEDGLLRRAHRLSEKWLVNPTVRRIFERQVLANVFNISVRSDEKSFSSARLQQWAERIEISEGEELCGDGDDSLYMLYSGEVRVRGRDGNDRTVFTGSFFNLDRLLISVGALPGEPSTLGAHATEDSMVLAVTRGKFAEMRKEDGALTQKLLMTLIVQNESNRPGRVRPSARVRVGLMGQPHGSGAADVAKRLLGGNDHKIHLTEAQEASFRHIFDTIDERGEGEIPMEQFSRYVTREAKALGSQIERGQFMEMIDSSGIDEDGDGSLTADEFLRFLRGLFLSDVPSGEMPALRSAYDAAVARAPDRPMDEARARELFAGLGFDVESSGWQDVVGVIDADGDGDVDFQEFLTGVGMMKKLCLLSSQLDAAFRDYKSQSIAKRQSAARPGGADPGPTTGRPLSSYLFSPMCPSEEGLDDSLRGRARHIRRTFSSMFLQRSPSAPNLSAPQDDLDDSYKEVGELDAGDLEAFLNIPRHEAEEMVFLADQDEVEVQNEQGSKGSNASVSAPRTIDRDEFQQLIRSWS